MVIMRGLAGMDGGLLALALLLGTASAVAQETRSAMSVKAGKKPVI